MRKFLTALCLAATFVAPAVANAEATPTVAATKAQYNVEQTDLGTLLDDPAAKAILAKHIPAVIANDQIDMARSMTLAQLKQYAGDALNDDVLKKIQADFDAAAPR